MNIDWFDCLPDEIIFEIFSNLDVVSLVSCSEVLFFSFLFSEKKDFACLIMNYSFFFYYFEY